VNQRQILRDLASVQYSRNDLEIGRGRPPVTYWRLVPLTKTELSGWNFLMRLTPFVTLIQ